MRARIPGWRRRRDQHGLPEDFKRRVIDDAPYNGAKLRDVSRGREHHVARAASLQPVPTRQMYRRHWLDLFTNNSHGMDIDAMITAKVQQMAGRRHGRQVCRTSKKRPVLAG